jgi:hypothetical protein
MSKTVLYIVAVVAIAAAIAMKVMAKDSHLTELSSYWWIPLPLALICVIGAGTMGKRKQ